MISSPQSRTWAGTVGRRDARGSCTAASFHHLHQSHESLTFGTFRDVGCKGASYGNQHDANLRDGNGRFDDSISSVWCG